MFGGLREAILERQRRELMARLQSLLIRITLLLTGVVSLQASAFQEKSNSADTVRMPQSSATEYSQP